MKLTDEAVGVVVANNSQGIITIDNFAQLNEKSTEGLLRSYKGLEGLQWGCPIQGLQCQKWLKQTYKE